MDQIGLVEPIDRLRQGVVVAVTLAAHRRPDAGLGQPLCVADAYVLRATVRMADQASRSGWRSYSACSNASSTKSVRIELLTRQPTIDGANTESGQNQGQWRRARMPLTPPYWLPATWEPRSVGTVRSSGLALAFSRSRTTARALVGARSGSRPVFS